MCVCVCVVWSVIGESRAGGEGGRGARDKGEV